MYICISMHVYAQLNALTCFLSPLPALSHSLSFCLLHTHTYTHTHMHTHQTGKEHNETRQKLHDIVKSWTVTRFPAPEIMQLSEGGSMARWLVCRLDPASKDAPAGASCGKFEI